MQPIKRWVLLLLILLSGLASYIFLHLIVVLAGNPLWLHPVLLVVLLLVAGGLLLSGQAVRRIKKRKPTWLSPVAAPYVVVTAQAVAYYASLQLGYLLAQVVLLTQIWDTTLAHRVVFRVGFGLLVTVLLLIIGLVVEKWCEIDQSDDQDKQSRNHFFDPQTGSTECANARHSDCG